MIRPLDEIQRFLFNWAPPDLKAAQNSALGACTIAHTDYVHSRVTLVGAAMTNRLECLSMSVDVKAHFTCSSDTVVLTSGVRVTARRVVSSCEMLRDTLVVRVADQHLITSSRVAVHG